MQSRKGKWGIRCESGAVPQLYGERYACDPLTEEAYCDELSQGATYSRISHNLRGMSLCMRRVGNLTFRLSFAVLSRFFI